MPAPKPNTGRHKIDQQTHEEKKDRDGKQRSVVEHIFHLMGNIAKPLVTHNAIVARIFAPRVGTMATPVAPSSLPSTLHSPLIIAIPSVHDLALIVAKNSHKHPQSLVPSLEAHQPLTAHHSGSPISSIFKTPVVSKAATNIKTIHPITVQPAMILINSSRANRGCPRKQATTNGRK